MKHDVKYNREKKYVIGSIEDDIELEPLKQYISDIADALRKYNCNKILDDFRTASVNMNILEIDEVPKLILQLGIDSSVKHALVVSDDFKKFDFFESTARAHRQNVKIFGNYAEAEEWLLGDAEFSSQAIPIYIADESK